MKTNQNLIRKMGEFDVMQRTSDGYFDANALLSAWNKSPLRTSKRRQQMSEFISSPNTLEFIQAINEEMQSADYQHERKNVNGDYQVVKEIKGRMTKSGRTKDQVWMHPYLFIDFAMWINPTFKVKVIKFVYDQLIQYRNDAGNTYKEMASAICKIVPKGEQAKAIQDISVANNHIVYGSHEKEIRNKLAEENLMKELTELQTDITKLINDGFITNFNSLMDYLRRKWRQKHEPKFLIS